MSVDAPAEQLSLLPRRAVISKPVSLEHIPLLRHGGKALEYGCALAELDPKELCPSVFTDVTVVSRKLSGERDITFTEAWRFNLYAGNKALSYYFNFGDGTDIGSIRPRVDDAQRRIRDLEEKLAERDRAIQLLVDAAHGRLGR